MTPRPQPTLAYLRLLEGQISRFLNTLQERLNELETVQQELYDAQTYLLQESAPLEVLAQVREAVNYLSNQHWAILQLTCIASHLWAVIQALLHSTNETPWAKNGFVVQTSLLTVFFFNLLACHHLNVHRRYKVSCIPWTRHFAFSRYGSYYSQHNPLSWLPDSHVGTFALPKPTHTTNIKTGLLSKPLLSHSTNASLTNASPNLTRSLALLNPRTSSCMTTFTNRFSLLAQLAEEDLEFPSQEDNPKYDSWEGDISYHSKSSQEKEAIYPLGRRKSTMLKK